jgi:hypothetical protein
MNITKYFVDMDGNNHIIITNIIVALAFLCLWVLLVIIEVKIEKYTILEYVFMLSNLCIVVSFVWVNKNILKNNDNKLSVTTLNYMIGIIISLVYIYLGVVFVTNFKFLIGGSI